MATLSNVATLYIGGASTVFTEEACTRLTANTVYQITLDAAERINPAVAIVVEVDPDGDDNWEAATGYTFNYLYGIATFTSDQGADALVRVSGEYLAVNAIGEAKECSLSFTTDLVETTTLATVAYKTRKATLYDMSGEFSGFQLPNVDLDAGAGTTKLYTLLAAGAPIFFEVDNPGSIATFRGWVTLEAIDSKITAGSLYESSVKFQASPILAADGVTYAAWGYAP